MSKKNKLQDTFLKIMYEMPEPVFVNFVITYCDQNNISLDYLIQKFIENKKVINKNV